MADTGQIKYSVANNGVPPSSVGSQIRTDWYNKKALQEAAKETYFGQLADTENMPKHYGKTIKSYHYLPLLDDANINDQGIDAAGASVDQKISYRFSAPGTPEDKANGLYLSDYWLTGEGATAGAAATAAELQAHAESFFINMTGDTGIWNTSFDQTVLDLRTAGWAVTDETHSDHGNGVAVAVPQSGNLYGSSKDIGTIQAKMPLLSETGGRVNRVGFSRIELEGSIYKLGFFDEYTQESLDFDTDEELEMHIHREMVMGANEITEDLLQIDLLNSAGLIRFGGIALGDAEITGDGGTATVSEVTYNDLMRMSIDLDDNRCPKKTKIIKGSRMQDTRVIDAARYMYIGSELIPMVRKMTDLFGVQAFIDVKHYADAGNIAVGEIGSIDQFRIIVVPEMMHWAGAGATVGAIDVAGNLGYRETDGKYDIYPMLVVGSQSFTTIGFQTDGKTVKFKIKIAKPGSTESYANDPFGETGFMSIKWWYGFMLKRPERIALAKVVAEW